LLFLLVAELIGSSCVSVIQAPKLHGQVTDVANGKPLEDVKITYIRGNYHDNTTSGGNGMFSIGPLADHVFFVYAAATIVVDLFNSYEWGSGPVVKFEHPGYLTQEYNVFDFNGNDFKYDPKCSWKLLVEMKKSIEQKKTK